MDQQCHYVGLDVSLETTSICVIDDAGAIIWRGKCCSDPDTITAIVRRHAPAHLTDRALALNFTSFPDPESKDLKDSLLISFRLARYQLSRCPANSDMHGIPASPLWIKSGHPWSGGR